MTSRPPAFLVGLPERKYRGRHLGSTRYEAFRHHIPVGRVPAPQATRFYSFPGGWRIDALIDSYTRPEWSVGAALMEASAALHMLTRRGTVYHSVRGEHDLCFLPRVARQTGNFLVASFHEAPDTIAYYIEERRIAEQLHAAILLGEAQRSYLAKYLPPERIFLVHHGVDTDFFRPAEAAPTDPVCIAVGAHMRDGKTLAAAMQQVWRVNPRVRLIAVGTRPGYEQDVSATPDLKDDRLLLLDRIPDAELLRLYQSASVGILCVGMSVANNALLEEMACGLPVVATDVGAVREYLGDEAGLYFHPGDAEALAAAVLRLLDDDATRRRIGAAARKRALGFDQRVVAEQMLQVYRRVEELG